MINFFYNLYLIKIRIFLMKVQLIYTYWKLDFLYTCYKGFKMQENENIAGGMSYRTFNGIDTTIMEYLEGFNEESLQEILKKNKNYYVKSADKTIARLELAKIRVESGNIDEKYAEIIYYKISTAIEWLNELKKDVINVSNTSKFLESFQYKKWHAVKMIPSASEGLLITFLISQKIEDIHKNDTSIDINRLKLAKTHNKNAELIFKKLLSLNERSDFKLAERLRIEGYGEAVLAHKKIEKK